MTARIAAGLRGAPSRMATNAGSSLPEADCTANTRWCFAMLASNTSRGNARYLGSKRPTSGTGRSVRPATSSSKPCVIISGATTPPVFFPAVRTSWSIRCRRACWSSIMPSRFNTVWYAETEPTATAFGFFGPPTRVTRPLVSRPTVTRTGVEPSRTSSHRTGRAKRKPLASHRIVLGNRSPLMRC